VDQLFAAAQSQPDICGKEKTEKNLPLFFPISIYARKKPASSFIPSAPASLAAIPRS
jgi:hypothetical protein